MILCRGGSVLIGVIHCVLLHWGVADVVWVDVHLPRQLLVRGYRITAVSTQAVIIRVVAMVTGIVRRRTLFLGRPLDRLLQPVLDVLYLGHGGFEGPGEHLGGGQALLGADALDGGDDGCGGDQGRLGAHELGF